MQYSNKLHAAISHWGRERDRESIWFDFSWWEWERDIYTWFLFNRMLSAKLIWCHDHCGLQCRCQMKSKRKKKRFFSMAKFLTKCKKMLPKKQINRKIIIEKKKKQMKRRANNKNDETNRRAWEGKKKKSMKTK